VAHLVMRPTSKWWYGRYRRDKKYRVVRFDVEIAGERPASLRNDGDVAFEQSRGKAMAALKTFVEDLNRRKTKTELAKEIFTAQTGEQPRTMKFSDLGEFWRRRGSKKKRSARYISQCLARIEQLAEYARDRGASCCHEFTNTDADTFMHDVGERVSAKTHNDSLKLYKKLFADLADRGMTPSSPFDQVDSLETSMILRRPFSMEQLEHILQITTDPEHNFIRPVIVTALCTAMRRGDCCLLRWESVDLAERIVVVKTSKTGGTAEIPLARLLEDVIREQMGNGSEFVFPEIAAMFEKNPDGITWRVKQVLKEALAGPKEPVPTGTEISQRVEQYLTGLPVTRRTERMRNVCALYQSGKSIVVVAKEAGCAKSTVSGYLNDIERGTDCSIIRGKARGTSPPLNAAREDGARRGSVYDIHSFRTTWVTVALTSGVPLELVKRVTGHRSVEVVLSHYFRPGRREFRQVLEERLPGLLTSGQNKKRSNSIEARRDQAVSLLKAATGDNWEVIVQAAIDALVE
jgi:integrase